MAKGQKRSNREDKKPKQTNKPVAPSTGFSPAPGKAAGAGNTKKR